MTRAHQAARSTVAQLGTSGASRREFLRFSAATLTACLVQTMLVRNLFADARPMALDDWIERLYRAGEQLDGGQISGAEWQREIDTLYEACDLAALSKHIDVDRVVSQIDLSTLGEVFVTTPLKNDPDKPYVPGLPEGKGVITKIAATRRDSAVPPHGHQNMVSAFLILSGEYHVRQYDKLESQGMLQPGEGSLVVRSVTDERQKRGQWSSISDDRSNVHWLRAVSDDCFFFSVKLINLKEDLPLHGRINIDVDQAQDLGSGRLQAPIITATEAAERYG